MSTARLFARLLQKLRRAPTPPQQTAFDIAREADVDYCYRLFLQREPDEAGYANWQYLVSGGNFELQSLIHGFLHSPEFLMLQERLNRPYPVDLDGFRLYVQKGDAFVGAPIARDKQYEPHVARELRRLLRPGDTFVDIGANIGYFSMLAAALVGPEGRVHAFEPYPDNCRLLEQSIASNGFHHVTLHEAAVDCRPGNLLLDVSGSNGRVVNPATPEGQWAVQLSTPAVVPDVVLQDLTRLDVVKIDVEGAEPRAWEGITALIRRFRPSVLFEFSPRLIRLTSQVEPVEFLRAVQGEGYLLFVVERNSGRQATAVTPAILLAHLRKTGFAHLDLLALPQ